MADDGQVRIGIYVDNEGVKSSMDQATQTVKDGTKEMSDAAEDAGKKMSDAVAKGFDTGKLQQQFKEVTSQVKSFAKTIAASVTGFGVWVKQSTASIDRIDKMSQKLGMTRKTFQELDYAASQTGISVNSFAGSMKALINASQSGGESLKKLGISIKTATGQMKTQEELFFEVANKLADMPPSIERTSLGFELLGKNFQQMAPLLNKGSAGIQELRDKFHELGLEISDQTVDDFVEFNDTLNDFSKTLKASFNNAIKGLIPQLKTVVENITKMLQPGGKLHELIGKLADVLYNFVTNILPPLLDGLNWVIDNATLVAAGITAIAVALKLLTGNWIGAIATGLIGIFSTVLISQTKQTAASIDEVTDSLKRLGVEVKNQGGMSPMVQVSGNLEEMKQKVAEATKELERLEHELAILPFDETITNSKEFADRETELKSKILTTRTEIEKYTKSIEDVTKRQEEVNEAVEESVENFDKWASAVADAEDELKKFIANNATLTEGFDIKKLDASQIIEYDALKRKVAETKAVLATLETAFEDTEEVIEKSDAFDKWTKSLEEAENKLKDFVASKADLYGTFDEGLLTAEEAKQFESLKNNVSHAREELETLKNTLKETKTEEQKVVEETKEAEDAFKGWTDAVDNAEKALKQFIAEKSTDTGFDITTLSQEDLARYGELKNEVTKTQKALDSMNAAMKDTVVVVTETVEQIENTEAFEKWTRAVQEAEDALKDFIATKAADTGTFNIDSLSDTEREKFEQLKQTVQEAKDQLKSLQDATSTTTVDIEDNLINVADTIASAWGQVGTALGNGIETVVQTLTNGEYNLKEAAWAMADALTNTLSAVGDALVQAGIAKQVVENLGEVSGSYAIAMGLAIKAAAGAIKGLFEKLKDGGHFAQGGIVGGNSYTGDRLLARVNSGEMILNRRQQQQLFALANGKGGGIGTGNNIQIINNAGDQVTAEQSIDGRSIKIMVEKFASNMLRGVKGSKLMGQTYGIRQLGRH